MFCTCLLNEYWGVLSRKPTYRYCQLPSIRDTPVIFASDPWYMISMKGCCMQTRYKDDANRIIIINQVVFSSTNMPKPICGIAKWYCCHVSVLIGTIFVDITEYVEHTSPGILYSTAISLACFQSYTSVVLGYSHSSTAN